MHILVTGGAGFIGSHLCDTLLERGDSVCVYDNFDPYYDPQVKRRNLKQAQDSVNFSLTTGDIRDTGQLAALFAKSRFDAIVHLAALAGVRESLERPQEFIDVNISGTLNLLEAARRHGKPRFILASTSSVYGLSPLLPYREDDPLLMPVSPYGASKIACEKLAHIYHAVHGLSCVSLRFFTAYGPRQRPDMAFYRFARAILSGSDVPVFGDGSSSRDYTYIGDIIQGVVAALDGPQAYDVINLGNCVATPLLTALGLLESALGQPARIKHLPEQPGDPPHTCADITHAREALGFEPQTPLADGIGRFVSWLAQPPACS